MSIIKICNNVCTNNVKLSLVVEWLACLNDPESYAGGGIAARRVTHAGQVKGDKPEEKVPWMEG